MHVNRTIQDLRELGALSKNCHGIEVENKDRLVQIAKFDASYLEGIWTRLDRRQELAGHRDDAADEDLPADGRAVGADYTANIVCDVPQAKLDKPWMRWREAQSNR